MSEDEKVSATGKRIGRVAREYATQQAKEAAQKKEQEMTEPTTTGSGPAIPPRGTPIIEVTDIGKSYGRVIALRDVTTSVKAGEVTCVLGDNGAGKSTFIKILAGAHQHTQGIVYAGWNPDWFKFFVGALLLGVILLNAGVRRWQEARA